MTLTTDLMMETHGRWEAMKNLTCRTTSKKANDGGGGGYWKKLVI